MFFFSAMLVVASVFYTSLKKISVKNIYSHYDTFQTGSEEFERLNRSYIDWTNIESDFNLFKDRYLIKFVDFPLFRKNLKLNFDRNSLEALDFKISYSEILKGVLIRSGINFKLSGKYSNVKKFIFEISKMKNMVFFRTVRLRKTKNNIIGDFFLEVYLVK